MADETFLLGFLNDDKSVINKSSPQTRKPCWITGKSLTSIQNIFVFKGNLNLVQLKTCYQTEREPSLSIYIRSIVRKV